MTAPRAFGTRVLNLFLGAKSATDILAQLESSFEGRIVIAYVIIKLGSALDHVVVVGWTFAGPVRNINRTLQAASNLVRFILVYLLVIALGAFWQIFCDATATYDPTEIGGFWCHYLAPSIGITLTGATLIRSIALTIFLTDPNLIRVMTAPGAFGTRVLNLFLGAKSATDIIAQQGSSFEGRIVIAYVIIKL